MLSVFFFSAVPSILTKVDCGICEFVVFFVVCFLVCVYFLKICSTVPPPYFVLERKVRKVKKEANDSVSVSACAHF